MKSIIKSYYKPTPAKWRKLGDAFLAISTFLTGLEIHYDKHTVAIVVLVTGVVGKFLTNFFAVKEKTHANNQSL